MAQVKQFDDWFEVTDTGVVYSLPRVINGRRYTGKKLTPRDSGRGLQVHCRLSTGEDKYLAVDRLVYSTFSGKKLKESDTIIHIDGDYTNNNFSNLALADKINNESGKFVYRIKPIFDE